MEKQMFCFQCEQTAGCVGCTGRAGVCGKPAAAAKDQDALTGALIGLARTGKHDDKSDRVVMEGLFTTITNVNFNEETIKAMTGRVNAEKLRLAPGLAPEAGNYDMEKVWNADEDVRSLKSLILFGIRGVSAYAFHAALLGYTDPEIGAFFCKALRAVGEDWGMTELLPIVMETGKVNLACMELLDRANTETFGNPVPTQVPLKVEKGPFIVVTGHDLLDLKMLLDQTSGKGVNVYTHGEMLPAHAYPELKKYPQLKGNFGTAWQNQQKEFAGIPGAVLYTTNCLMPPRDSYSDRIFTTNVVSFPDIPHIGEDKDFTPVIEKALELGGYPEEKSFTGMNGGETVTTGFGHGFVLGAADKVVEAVKSGALRHIFLVGGCDGARPGRNYYTEFVKQTPPDTLVLTLACGKYRFNDLDLGTVGGLPRLMDMGQCNDAYSAIKVAVALAGAFGCGVNDLPLSMVLSWYEQKAVCILLTLLYLGIKNIRLGPTLPAFISPNVLDYLVKNYGIAPITTPEEDLKTLLG
jgi:hydroxylamine reductase